MPFPAYPRHVRITLLGHSDYDHWDKTYSGRLEKEISAIVEEFHAYRLPVVAHAHRPDEIRLGRKFGVDRFEHTRVSERTRVPRRHSPAHPEAHGPMYWCPTISEGKIADIIAVKGEVLRYIDLLKRVDLVIKHGRWLK